MVKVSTLDANNRTREKNLPTWLAQSAISAISSAATAAQSAANDAATAVAAKYTKPSGGIPASDIATATLAADANMNAAFLPRWAANTAYPTGFIAIAPTGEIIKAKTSFTSATSYAASNWDVISAASAASPSLSARDIRSFLQSGETLDRTGGASVHVILQRARDALASEYASTGVPQQIYFPNGRYRIDTRSTWKSGVGIQGESMTGVKFLPQGNQSFIHQNDRTRCDDCNFSDFTVDGSAQTDTVYTAQVKGIYITDMRRATFERVVIKDVWSSGFGVDYLDQSIITNCYALRCGRGIKVTGINPATTSGGSGFGIGTGATTVESLQIINCVAIDNGLHGFFTEKQDQVSFYSRGFTMSGCTARGNWIGFRDCGSIGAAVTDSQFIGNGLCGVSLDKTVLAANAGTDGTISDCVISGNGALAGSVAGGGVVIAQAANGGYTVRDNEIMDNTGPGVHVTSAAVLGARYAIVRNRIRRNTAEGITVKAAQSFMTVSGNELWENTGAAISFPGTGTTATSLALTNNDVRAGGCAFAHTLAGAWAVTGNLGFSLLDPTGLTATQGPTGSAIAAAWSAPVDASGLTDYLIETRLANTGSYTAFAHTASTSTSITITGLTPSTAYDVRVAAVRGGNISGYSNVATVTTAAAGSTGVVATDDFERTDNSTSLGDAQQGGTWQYAGGGLPFRIVSGAANRAGDGATGFAYLPVTVANGQVNTTLTTASAANAGIVMRFVDISNYLWADATAGTGVRLFARINGTNTALGTGSWTAGGDLTLRIVDSTITVLQGSTVKITAATPAGLPASGYVGLRSSSLSSGPSIYPYFTASVL